MSNSSNTVFLNEDLDNANEISEEQASSHLVSDESSSCLFDILSTTSSGHSFHSSLLEDIDLDLQCEDDVDCANSVGVEETVGHSLHTVYSLNGAVNSTTTVDCYNDRHLVPSDFLTEDQRPNNRIHSVQDSSIQLRFLLQASLSDTRKSSNIQNLANKRLATCKMCSIQFSCKEALVMHNKDKHVKKEIILHECTHCHINFKSLKSLLRHAKMHKEKHEEKHIIDNCIYLCESCPYVTKTRTLLSYHIRTQHNLQRKIYCCEQCQFSCFQKQTFTIHLQRHKGDPKFACDQCGKLFLTMGILKRHAHTHNKTRAYFCHCGKSFNIKSRLTDHKRTVHINSRRVLEIDSSTYQYCSNSEQPGNLLVQGCKQYDSNKHPESGISICNGTSVPTSNSSDICMYDIILPEDQTGIFNSAVDKKTDLKTYCASSIVNVNKNMIPHKIKTQYCRDSTAETDECSVSQNCSLQKDVTKRKFTCTWEGCHKEFRDNYNLNVHRCTHTGEMQRACNLCRYRCVQKSAMDAHMRTHNKMRQPQEFITE